jgi:hypothetical protein
MTSPASADFVTRHEFEMAMARIDSRFGQLETTMDLRFAQVDSRFERLEARLDARFARLDTRFAEFDTRFAEFETRFAGLETRFTQVDGRIAEGEGRLEALIERSLVASIRWTVGVSFGLYALMFGLILFVVARELPHA